jgi:ABC-type lipoprotein release transport system permease subunit
MFRHYLAVAFRNLWKYRLQNIIGITGLSIGFICFSVVVINIEWNINCNIEYPGAKRMHVLEVLYGSDYNGNIYSLNRILPEIEKITLCKEKEWNRHYFYLDSTKAQYHNFNIYECDTAFIDFFSLEVLAGNKYAINRTVNSIVLFDTEAKRIDENIHSVIGKTIQEGDEKFQITGVIKKPVNSSIMAFSGFVVNREGSVFRDEIYNKFIPGYTAYIMLKDGVPLKKFRETLSNRQFDFSLQHEERLQGLRNADGTYAGDEFAISPVYNPLQYIPLTDYLEKLFVGLLILLTTLFNYTSFQISQFYGRLRECALRRAAGAGKKDLFFMFFCEIIIAFIVTYLLSILLTGMFRQYIRELYWYPDINDLIIRMLKYLLFVILIASVLYLIPINIIHKMSIRTVFTGISQKGNRGVARTGMLFFQLAVLVLFLSAFAIVGLQTNKYQNLVFSNISKEDRKDIIYTILDSEAVKSQKAIAGEIASSPSVKGILPVRQPVMSDRMCIFMEEAEIPNYFGKMAGMRYVYPEFFDFFQCELLEGKFFTEDSSPNDIVIDENFASYYKDKSPVGESFYGYKIVGVIKNLHTQKDRDDWELEYIPPSGKFPVFYSAEDKDMRLQLLYVKARRGKIKEVEQLFRETVMKFVPPHHNIYITNFGEEIERAIYEETRLFRSMQVLFVISLIICLLGIYSAIVMSTEKRRKEIAISKINGATVKDIIALFMKKYVVLWTAACAVSFPAVYYFGNRWLEKYLERISPGVSFFTAIYIAVMTLIFLTVIFRILKVARCNPAEVIKKG